MSNINEQLDIVRERIQDPMFLSGEGLSNEINIHIFCYNPKDEMAVRHFISQIVSDQSLECHPIECNLYKIFLSICNEMDIIDAIVDMESENGSEFMLEQLHSAIGDSEFISKMDFVTKNPGDILLITGVGEAFPFMRVHKLLEAIQPHFSEIPVLVMYPGEFNNHQLKLFKKLKPNAYYRAFNII